MFTAKRAMFLYAVTPVHMGAGTAFGLIDNPIQREVHTNHPLFAGSGLKGALRAAAKLRWKDTPDLVESIFGPDTKNADAFAGALSLSDAVLIAFPVRCLKRGFIYATSAQALARAARLLALTDGGKAPWSSIDNIEDKALAATDKVAIDGKLILEAFEFPVEASENGEAAKWLADKAIPPDEPHQFFREKLKQDLVVLPEDAFGHFVERATVVEPHVRINDATGTADEGGLFYTENLPPESLLLAAVMASQVRRNGGGMSAEDVLARVAGNGGFGGAPLQIGGDATTGRGQVLVRFVQNGGA
jgi:CRISPR-associated protein Cmr4